MCMLLIFFSIEQDTKVREQLRLQSDALSEIDMLKKQASQEFEGLRDKIKENSGLLSANGEIIRITEDDPVMPIQLVKGNIRIKYENAEKDIERSQKAVSDLQSKVTEKNALLQNHRGRLAQLQLRANQLDHEDGPVQKISRVVSICALLSHLYLLSRDTNTKLSNRSMHLSESRKNLSTKTKSTQIPHLEKSLSSSLTKSTKWAAS